MNESNRIPATPPEPSPKEAHVTPATRSWQRRSLTLVGCFVRGVAQHAGALTVGFLVGWWDSHR